MSTGTKSGVGLEALEARIKRDLEYLAYPKRNWVCSRKTKSGEDILDVLIIGGGQSGLAAAFQLLREKVKNILVIDENPEGKEGPWLTFARMNTLRTPKYITGPDLGLPNLTPRAWYEACFGADSWTDLSLLPKELWAQYLAWYRRLLDIPVENESKAGAIDWIESEQCFAVPVKSKSRDSLLYARKVVMATGIDGSGHWEIPSIVANNLPPHLYAHTRAEIDFSKLKGKRIAVLGAGASAFDNASVALEQGATEVHLFFRREILPNINPYRWAEFVGFLKHHGELPDHLKWKFIRQIIAMGQLPPTDTYARATGYNNFLLHPGEGWKSLSYQGNEIYLDTNKAEKQKFDFIIIGTGFVTDLSLRPELANLLPEIALWRDRFNPPSDESNDDLLRHPYLGPNFEFSEKYKGQAPYLRHLYNYTFGCLLSLGFGGASISGMKYSVQRLVFGITRDLFVDDAESFFASLEAFKEREF